MMGSRPISSRIMPYRSSADFARRNRTGQGAAPGPSFHPSSRLSLQINAKKPRRTGRVSQASLWLTIVISATVPASRRNPGMRRRTSMVSPRSCVPPIARHGVVRHRPPWVTLRRGLPREAGVHPESARAAVHVARAGRPNVDGHRHAQRCPCPWGDPLRAADRVAADRREAVPARCDPGDAAGSGRAARPLGAVIAIDHLVINTPVARWALTSRGTAYSAFLT